MFLFRQDKKKRIFDGNIISEFVITKKRQKARIKIKITKKKKK